MTKDKDLVKSLKKLNVKPGDIVVWTLGGSPYPHQVEQIRNEFTLMPFMKGVNLIITTDDIRLKKAKPHAGRHRVFLDNLEYLEYLSRRKK
jgi:hypothetical protein